MRERVARFQNVSKTFAGVTALNELNFDIYAGEILAFLGPNGAGKSTSLQLLTGLRRPSSGRVELFGVDPQNSISVRSRLGMTPQELDFPPHLQVREVLQLVSKSYGRGDPEVWRSRLHLERVWQRRTQGLSGGEKRRLGLACALMAAPDLLLLDEPTTGLDVESRRLLWKCIREERERGAAICLTTHDLSEAEKLADRVLVIDQGRKFFEGSLQEIRSLVDLQRVEFHLAGVDLPRLQDPSLTALWMNMEIQQQRVTLWTSQSDQVVHAFVEKGLAFQGLLIHASSLEEAFLQIRRSGAEAP